MKTLSKVGFFNKENDTITYMDYFEVDTYCKNKIIEKNLAEDFSQSGYKAFDYVMRNMHYIFVNPLFQNNKYLIWNDGSYYTVDKMKVMDFMDDSEDGLYKSTVEVFSKKIDTNIFMLEDTQDITGANKKIVSYTNCFITPTGEQILKPDWYRHQAVAATICHNELTKSQTFCQKYFENMMPSIHYAEFFLVSICNYVEVDYDSNTCTTLYNKSTINQNQQETIEKVIGKEVTIINVEEQNNITCMITENNVLDNSPLKK